MNAPINTSLYVLAGEYLALSNKLMDSELDPQTIADTLESAAGDLEVKATNVVMFSRNLRASAASIEEAAKQMMERAKALKNKADGIDGYVKDNMQRTGINKIECPYFAISLQKNPPSVIVDDMALIPADYMVTPTLPPPAPDKALIKKAIGEGHTVPGCHLEQGERLVIK